MSDVVDTAQAPQPVQGPSRVDPLPQDLHCLQARAEPVGDAPRIGAYPRELLAQARLQAGDERLLSCLARLAGDDAATFTQRLGATLHYPVLDSQTLFASTPLFEQVSLAQCLKREFILVQHQGQAVGVFKATGYVPRFAKRLAYMGHRLPEHLFQSRDLLPIGPGSPPASPHRPPSSAEFALDDGIPEAEAYTDGTDVEPLDEEGREP